VDPGVNPHTGQRLTERTIRISHTPFVASASIDTRADLQPMGPFWWSTPGLMKNGDPSGAQVFLWKPGVKREHIDAVRWGHETNYYLR